MRRSFKSYSVWLLNSFMSVLLAGTFLSSGAMATEPSSSPNAIKFTKYIVAVQDLDKAYAFYHALGAELDQATALEKSTSISPALGKLFDVPTETKFRSATLKIPGSSVAMQLVEFANLARSSSGPRFHDPGAVQLVLEVRDIKPALDAAKTFGVKVVTSGEEPVAIGFPGDPAPTHAIVVNDLDGHYVEFVKLNPKHVVNEFGITPAASVPNISESPSNILFPSFRTVVGDVEKTVAFYRGHFGLEANAPPWAKDAENLMRMSGLNTMGDVRVGEMRVQGTLPMHGWTFFQTTANDALSYQLRLPDRGGYAIGLEVHDLSAAVSAIKGAGGSLITSGDGWVSVASGDKLALVRDSSGITLELVQRAAGESK